MLWDGGAEESKRSAVGEPESHASSIGFCRESPFCRRASKNLRLPGFGL